MIPIKQIKEGIQPIIREYRPERIILFGSYAADNPTEDSDVDLMIILPFKGGSVHQAVGMRLKMNTSFPVDLVVRTPEKVQERLDLNDSFMMNIVKNGRLLYEAHNT